MKKQAAPAPTEQELLKFRNVPVALAAQYIGWSSATLYYALQGNMDSRSPVPFGFAVRREGGGWVYNISPHALIKYHHGELPLLNLEAIQTAVHDAVVDSLEAKLNGVNQFLTLLNA